MSDKTVLTPDEIRELKCELARVNAQLFPSQAHIAMELAVTCIEQLERAVLAAATPGKEAVRDAALEEAIKVVESIQWPVGNSAAGEMAAEWTMEKMREARDAIRALKSAPAATEAGDQR